MGRAKSNNINVKATTTNIAIKENGNIINPDILSINFVENTVETIGDEVVVTPNPLVIKNGGLEISPDVKTINFIGASVSDEGSKEVNVEITIDTFETVDSIPSYLKTDGITVIDNGNATYNILELKSNSIYLSLFGAKDDLEYFNVTTDGSTATILYSGFDQSYVGKSIRIKDAHQNPDTAGTEVPNTTLGRIVTVSAKIISVVDGVSATLDFTPNRAGLKRAYCFTNNSEALIRALRFCEYRKIPEIIVNYTGILGFDLYDKGIYSTESIVGFDVDLALIGRKIIGTGAKFKATNEFDYTATSFFNLKTGSNDFYLDVSVLPADQFGQDPQQNNKVIVRVDSAGNSIRTITIKNQKYNKNNFDGNDAFWSGIINGDSTGGRYSVSNGRESQVFVLKNNSARCKNGSYSNFQNDGYSNEMFFEDVHFNDIQHFEGERGREFETDPSVSPMTWQYNTANFSVTSNVVTTTEPDFSWYDHEPNAISITLTINGQSATISSITDAKTAVLNAGIGDTSGQNCIIKLTNRSFYNHPVYIHPSMICTMIRCKSNKSSEGTDGKIKMYSDGGSVQDELGRWFIIDCIEGLYNLETYSGGTSSTACITKIYNSKVEFYSISGYCYVKDCEITGKFIGHEFKSLGGNKFGDGSTPYFVATINDNNLNHTYNSSDKGNFQIRYIGSNVNVIADGIQLGEPDGVLTGATLPMVQNGTLTLRNITVESPIVIYNMFSFTSNTIFIFENFKMNYYDETNSFLRDVGFNTALWSKWKNTRYYSNYNDPNPIDFDNTGINVGKFDIISDESIPFYVRKDKPQFNLWNFYKELEYIQLNLGDSNIFKVKDFSFSLIIGSFLQTSNETDPSVQTGTTNNSLLFTYNNLPLFRGTFQLIFEGSCVASPYHHTNGAGANNSSLRENSTLSNMVLKSLERTDGEIVTFKVDPIDGRVIEIDSSEPKKYTSLKPTRLGVVGERLYKSDGQYWEYEIDFVDDSTNSYAGTQTDVAELSDVGATIRTNTHIDITGTPEWSIGQEKTDGSTLEIFDFTLNINGGGTLEFEYATSIAGKTVNAHYNKYLWQFKSSDGAGYECFINNRTGQIVFNGIISETLDTTNIITINSGNKITRREWVLKGIKDISDDVSTSYTFTSNDDTKTFNNASPVSAELPTNATDPMPLNKEIDVVNKGSGVVTIGGAGVTINTALGGLTLSQYEKRTLKQVEIDVWILTY